jgi:dipeptidyl-peptidase-4
MRSFLALSLALLAPAAAQQKKPVTIEALSGATARMMAQMAGAPVWSPAGGRFVYRQRQTLMLYEIASRSRKELLNLGDLENQARRPAPEPAMSWENRRVAERPIQWSSDGKKLLLLVHGDLFFWTEGAAKPEQLTATPVAERDAKLSPDGGKVSYRIDKDLWVLDIASKKSARLTHDGSATLWNGMLDWVYPEELDLGTAHWWSPDSKSIAYLQFDVSREPLYPHADHLPIAAVGEPQRYPKAGMPNADVRVGVVSAAGGETRWMDFGETRDFLIARVHWTPDSRVVVVHRLNRVQDRLDILSADPATGVSKLLIRETDKHWINLTNDFFFLSDGRILRSSEKDGFRHLYLHSASGREEMQLTRGAWESAGVSCVDEKQKRIYFVSSEASPLERHLYSVSFEGRDKRRITPAEGSHAISMSPACDAFLDNHSSLASPSRGVLYSADGAQIEVWREAETKTAEEYEILPTEIHPFKGADGTTFYGRLIKPAGFDPAKKYPAVVQIYGGPHAQSVRNSYAGLSFDQVLAHRGFVIWQMDNRGSAGRGHAFETPVYRRLGKQELEDQKEGIKYLVAKGFVDPARIGVMGWSYGGYMTLYCLLHAPEIFKAGSAGASVTDWRNYDTIYTERYMGLPRENEENYKLSSPVHAAANLKGKLLLIHNIEDDNVLFANALQMSNALQQAGKEFEFLLYPQKSHGVTGKARTHMLNQQLRFFEQALK